MVVSTQPAPCSFALELSSQISQLWFKMHTTTCLWVTQTAASTLHVPRISTEKQQLYHSGDEVLHGNTTSSCVCACAFLNPAKHSSSWFHWWWERPTPSEERKLMIFAVNIFFSLTEESTFTQVRYPSENVRYINWVYPFLYFYSNTS